MAAPAPAASSECTSGCQSGWTMYLDDHSSSCSSARLEDNISNYKQPPFEYSEETDEEMEDDLSMISDASSGPRQLLDAHDAGAAAYVNAEMRSNKQVEPAARRQGKMAAVASLLEDTASSPAFKYSNGGPGPWGVSSSEANGGVPMPATRMDMSNAADFSCAFSATTSCKSTLNGSRLGYLQMQYSAAPIKPIPRRPVCRDMGNKKRW